MVSDDGDLLAALRGGDEAAFSALVQRYHGPLVRLAQQYVRDRQVAEEVVQDTWLAVLQGIDRFEQRSSFKTWLFRILVNQAKTRGVRERRSTPFATLAARELDGPDPAVEPERFGTGGAWSAPPRAWEHEPEERLLAQETLGALARAIEALPPAQREVIRLRDVDGWDAAEVCEALGLTDGNQRVLLHRARSKVREALERELAV